MVASGEAAAWFILSGKHGLVEPTEELAPYDERVPGAGVRMQAWGDTVVSELRRRFPESPVCSKCEGRFNVNGKPCRACKDQGLEIVVLAGSCYVSPISTMVAGLHLHRSGWSVHDPLLGLEIGERLSWFKTQRAARAAAALPPKKAEKVRKQDEARVRHEAAKHARVVRLEGAELDLVKPVACPICQALVGSSCCWDPVGKSRWELLPTGVVHAARQAEAKLEKAKDQQNAEYWAFTRQARGQPVRRETAAAVEAARQELAAEIREAHRPVLELEVQAAPPAAAPRSAWSDYQLDLFQVSLAEVRS
jgi:hypothetical protein